MKNFTEKIYYHVSMNGTDQNEGTLEHPFKTITAAARVAKAGDQVIVHAGTYREWVKPVHGGTSDQNRIIFQAASGEQVFIKGSEIISTWEKAGNQVWKVTLDASFFGKYNPYQDIIYGDWFDAKGRDHHTGEVYLNGKSLYEVESLEKVESPVVLEGTLDPEGSLLTWYCKSDTTSTTIWANFQGQNPNTELVEINVRPSCFYPEQTGVNYITVRGFHLCHAATQWAPPTAEQIGLIGAHWSKGWIIEENIISDSKCSAISLGKERLSGHNYGVVKRMKPGFQYQLEAVFKALQIGWNKEQIGSHIVRNNTIYNCEQAGIVGHMGCAFSQVTNNHIYNIWTKRQFTGAEIAGIKFHAPIDTVIKGNRIHDCKLGIWMDWQAQGTRITGNLLYRNEKDLMIEVCHGPYLVDNNILVSGYGMDLYSQGGAFAHNLIAGTVNLNTVPNRATPYHYPHSTAVAGTALIFGGDDRYFNNVFTKSKAVPEKVVKNDNGEMVEAKGAGLEIKGIYGLKGYDEYTPSYDAYFMQLEKVWTEYKIGTVISFSKVLQPVWIHSNLYFNDCKPCIHENASIKVENFDPEVRIEETTDGVFLHFQVDSSFFRVHTKLVTPSRLGIPRIVDAAFEDPNGEPITIDTDYFGKKRHADSPSIGPIEGMNEGWNRVKVWQA